LKLKLVITQQGPPGGWYYKDPETGREFKPVAFDDMLGMIKAQRKANNLPIPANLREQVEEQVCQHVPPEWCEGRDPKKHPVEPLTFEQALSGTAVMIDWMLHGAKIIEQKEADERSKICAHCHFNSGISGCSNCSMGRVRELVAKIVGNKVTVGDGRIQACKICGCALKAKVWIPLDILQKHMSAEQNDQFPEWCWCKKTQTQLI